MAAATQRKLVNEFVTVETTDATATEGLVIVVPAGWFGRLTAYISAQDANSSGGILYGTVTAYVSNGGPVDVASAFDGGSAGTLVTGSVDWITSVSGDSAVEITGVASRTVGWAIRVRGELQYYPLSG